MCPAAVFYSILSSFIKHAHKKTTAKTQNLMLKHMSPQVMSANEESSTSHRIKLRGTPQVVLFQLKNTERVLHEP